jgi:peptidylprolyl isomerase
MRSPRTLRLPLRASAVAPLVAFGLLVAACGDSTVDDGTKSESTDNASAGTDAGTPATDPAAGSGDTVAADTVAADAVPTNPDKPTVSIPDVLPTELVITDLTAGTGPEAAAGDTVVVNYVGVRSEDGTEFDNSYDRGSPFPVTLGANSVIQGWEQGLVGAQQGGRRQLDIPSDLAYGDAPQGDVIQAGDALTFVIDVVAVIAAADPADEPTVSVDPGSTVEATAIDDLEPGEGDAVAVGQSLVFNYIILRTDTGETLESSWLTGQPQTIPYDEAQIPPVLVEGLDGVKVGTKRQITIPYSVAKDTFQLPGETDIVLYVEIIAIY